LELPKLINATTFTGKHLNSYASCISFIGISYSTIKHVMTVFRLTHFGLMNLQHFRQFTDALKKPQNFAAILVTAIDYISGNEVHLASR
jgi:hypothetical protein